MAHLSVAMTHILLHVASYAWANFTSVTPPHCLNEPLPDDVTEWQDHVRGSAIRVEWGFGNDTCTSVNGCFGLAYDPDIKLEAQLPPLQTQRGVVIRFVASSSMDVRFKIRPRKVDEMAFRHCNTSSGVALVTDFTQEEITVSATMLELGSNYFIAETTDLLYQCRFGLRINVTIKEERCHDVGETTRCWNKGRCLSNVHQSTFSCHCCQGYGGQYCQETDGCLDNPCQNNASCYSLGEDSTGAKVGCACPQGFYGDLCESHVENMCQLNQCLNNGSCAGDKDNYTCVCANGFEGHHCEIDTNDCAQKPCNHGVCVDKPNGHQCYCEPGYTGSSCSVMLPHCDVNHCKHSGVCIENENGIYCHCTRGYTGPDCSVKVDLCSPSPCENALECVDNGNIFYCTCKPGYAGVQCEIDINECASEPCHHGGRCVDMVSSFRCVCPRHVHGELCQYEQQIISEHEYEGLPFDSPWRHRTPIQNLAIIAGTLGGAVTLALLILAGCYCKVHETYKHLFCDRRAVCKGYTRHVDEDTKRRIRNSSLSESRPSVDAILHATSSDYDSNQLNPAVLATLKPRRV